MLGVNHDHPVQKQANEIAEFLSSGCFYYTNSPSFDLAKTKQSTSFLWNRVFLTYFPEHESFFCKIICGYARLRKIYLGVSTATIALISRLSIDRVGTRFKTRGVDDRGHVANFVETEQIIIFENGVVSSFTQIRGSIPFFWSQTSIALPGQPHKINLDRKNPLDRNDHHANILTVRKHFENVMMKMFPSKTIAIFNLVKKTDHWTKNASEVGEKQIGDEFKFCIDKINNDEQYSTPNKVLYFDFDLHAQPGDKSEVIKRYLTHVNSQQRELGIDLISDSTVIRTNCIDCLDRTNLFQTQIGLYYLIERQLPNNQVPTNKYNEFVNEIAAMWKDNGDNLSILYAGTEAMGTGSKLKELTKSIARSVNSSFSDDSKLAIMKRLSGTTTEPKLDPLVRSVGNSYLDSDQKNREILKTIVPEICNIKGVKVAVGTFNVNARTDIKKDHIKAWLNFEAEKRYKAEYDYFSDNHGDLNFSAGDTIICSQNIDGQWGHGYREGDAFNQGIFPYAYTTELSTMSLHPDVFVIGFQEICDLSAKNVVQSSDTNAKIWLKCMTEYFQDLGDYCFVSHEQLVGIALFVFVKKSLVPRMTQVGIKKVKTGFGGATGNKGAIAATLTINSSSMLFICAHLAAGEKNVSKRNQDFTTITNNIEFENLDWADKGSANREFEYVVWLGDFNYRVNWEKFKVEQAIAEGRLEEVKKFDQLALEMQNGRVFKGFSEAEITFQPTYKYDIGTDRWDTSEKQRIPSWTDRILWKRDSRFVSISLNTQKVQVFTLELISHFFMKILSIYLGSTSQLQSWQEHFLPIRKEYPTFRS